MPLRLPTIRRRRSRTAPVPSSSCLGQSRSNRWSRSSLSTPRRLMTPILPSCRSSGRCMPVSRETPTSRSSKPLPRPGRLIGEVPSSTKDLGSALGLFYFLFELLSLPKTARLVRMPNAWSASPQLAMSFPPCTRLMRNIHSHLGGAGWFRQRSCRDHSLANEGCSHDPARHRS